MPTQDIQAKFIRLKSEISKVIVGQNRLIHSLLIGLLAEGHLLLEGVPGVAKTLAANTFAKTLGCQFKRIQFTPDLLPVDLIGTSIYSQKEGSFSVKKGPIFTQILLADEINRAPAKVQSALLEVMQEKQVTIAGESFKFSEPFLVMATQNPIELEGTYPLAEAQTDRFLMKVKIDYPSREEEKEILRRMGSLNPIQEVSPILSVEDIQQAKKCVDEVYVDDRMSDYLLDIIMATRQPKAAGILIEGYLDCGVSPRGGIGLRKAAKAAAFLDGRSFVTPQDVKNLCLDVLRHRLRLSYEAEANKVTAEDIIHKILDHIKVP